MSFLERKAEGLIILASEFVGINAKNICHNSRWFNWRDPNIHLHLVFIKQRAFFC